MLCKSLMIAGSAALMLSALPASAQPNPPVNQQNPSTIDPKPCAPGERLQIEGQPQRAAEKT